LLSRRRHRGEQRREIECQFDARQRVGTGGTGAVERGAGIGPVRRFADAALFQL
jgi:hypothetical protein